MEECFCGRCGYNGRPRRASKGNVIVEVLLYAVGISLIGLIVPFLVAVTYSIVRHFSGRYVCAECGSIQLIPESSPRGLDMIRAERAAKQERKRAREFEAARAELRAEIGR